MLLPDYLKSGEVARLFPVISETGKEQRAASIMLAVMSAVPGFTGRILNRIGQRIGARSSINTFTEVVFRNASEMGRGERPDGLIEIRSGKKCWSALLETKIGNATLDQGQIERYLRLARENGVDAVLTISNEFTALPNHHPLDIQKSLLKRTELFHFSWKDLLTEAVLLQEQSAVGDPEQAFLLRELIRFFSHPSAGVTGFTSMPKEWGNAVETIQAGGSLARCAAIDEIIGAWHQELRDLSLVMSRIIGCTVRVKLSRAHVGDSDKHHHDAVEKLCSRAILEGTIDVPNAASDIHIIADLNNRSTRVSMTVDAPRNKKTTRARLNWLLRQIKHIEDDSVFVGTIWASRAPKTVVTLAELRSGTDSLENATRGSEIRAFEITMVSASARRFAGRRTFIEELESLAPRFYELVGQHLESWQPPPPKPKHSIAESDPTDAEPAKGKDRQSEKGTPLEETVLPMPGNSYTALMDIPEFLRRS